MTGPSPHDFAPDLVRRAADGELAPGEAAPVLPDGSEPAGVRFERELRAAVGRAMGDVRAPAALADRVRSAMSAAGVSEAVRREDAADELVGVGGAAGSAPAATPSSVEPPAVEAAAGADRMRFLRWLESPRQANAAAVAAVLALVIGAIGFGVVMRPITQWGQVSGSRFVEQAAHFTANEHGRCTGPEVLESKVAGLDDVDEARAFLARHLNRDVTSLHMPDFTDRGHEFIGVSACKVPGRLPSAHAVWRSRTPDASGRRELVSVFVTLDRDQFELQSADAADVRVREVLLADGSRCERTVRVIRRDGLVIFVVCCDESSLDECSRRVATAIAG